MNMVPYYSADRERSAGYGMYLGSGEALVSGRLKVRVSFGLLVVLLDQLCCLGTVVDAVQQACVQQGVLSIWPARQQAPCIRLHETVQCRTTRIFDIVVRVSIPFPAN